MEFFLIKGGSNVTLSNVFTLSNVNGILDTSRHPILEPHDSSRRRRRFHRRRRPREQGPIKILSSELPLPARRPPPSIPQDDGAGDIQAETSSLQARLDTVLDAPNTIFVLRYSARDSAADVYSRGNRRQRENLYVEEAKIKRAERARYFATRSYYGQEV